MYTNGDDDDNSNNKKVIKAINLLDDIDTLQCAADRFNLWRVNNQLHLNIGNGQV